MTLHIDGSECSHRITYPQKSQIIRYWKDNIYEYFGTIIDWGEPSCWACGYYNEKHPINEDLTTPYNKLFKVWNKHPYLERCHITPKALGGCNCAANLVLLCKKCHKASPDSRNPILFQYWVQNQRRNVLLEIEALKQVAKELQYKYNYEDAEIIISENYLNYLSINGVKVGGKYSLATIISCLIEFKG